MKQSLDHLPKLKQQEIQAIATIIRQYISKLGILKLVLFGSFARGDWVEDYGVDEEDGSGYEYISDYDFLIIVEKSKYIHEHMHWRKLEEALDQVETKCPINIIKHTIKEVNILLSEGQYFFSDIVREGVLLYDNGEALAEARELTPEEQLEVNQTRFDHWFERALQFLRTYGFLFKTREYRTAAFTLHQATESLFACLLLVKTGYKPRSHDLQALEKRAIEEIEPFERVFPRDSQQQRDLFELLCAAYISARYKKHFPVCEEELLALEQSILNLKQVTHGLCRDTGIVTDMVDEISLEKPSDEFIAELEQSWENSDQKDLTLKNIRKFREEGYEMGEKNGVQKGFERGKNAGLKRGKKLGYERGEQAGLEKGLVTGREEEALKIAKAMKEKGADWQFIADTTGLSMETIEIL